MSQPLNILLIEDNPMEARWTQQWLTHAKVGSFAVEWVERIRFALERLDRGGIDIVLLDLNLPDSRGGLATFLTLHSHVPQVPIVVLTGEDDEVLGTSAVEKGAQDYLVKHQINGTSLARVLRYAHVRQRTAWGPINKPPHTKTARTIGFLGAKGGVGTTLVAFNVAAALAKQRRAVILAEMRPSFGTLAHDLSQEPAKSLRTLLDHFPDHLGEHDLERFCAMVPPICGFCSALGRLTCSRKSTPVTPKPWSKSWPRWPSLSFWTCPTNPRRQRK